MASFIELVDVFLKITEVQQLLFFSITIQLKYVSSTKFYCWFNKTFTVKLNALTLVDALANMN